MNYFRLDKRVLRFIFFGICATLCFTIFIVLMVDINKYKEISSLLSNPNNSVKQEVNRYLLPYIFDCIFVGLAFIVCIMSLIINFKNSSYYIVSRFNGFLSLCLLMAYAIKIFVEIHYLNSFGASVSMEPEHYMIIVFSISGLIASFIGGLLKPFEDNSKKRIILALSYLCLFICGLLTIILDNGKDIKITIINVLNILIGACGIAFSAIDTNAHSTKEA